MKRYRGIFLPVVFLFFLFGCGSGSSGDNHAKLAVSLTDGPACGFDQVNVTPSKIRVHPSANAGPDDADWSEVVLSPPRKIDLLSLTNGVIAPLGTIPLAPGHYAQLRLVLLPNTAEAPLNNSVVPTGGVSETALEIPNAIQDGIKLIYDFDIAAKREVDLVLDLDPCRSVAQKENGGAILNPFVSVIPQEVSGGIQGMIGTTLSTGSVLIHPRITAQQDGTVIGSTLPDQSGNFILRPLIQSATAGNYDLVFTADNAATAVIQSVPVTAQAMTTVSTADHPIVLQPSAIRTIRGTVTPTSATLRAVQHFAPGGPTVEIRLTNAVVGSGNYSLLLPADSPSLGLFGTGMLPIVLTLRPDAAGRYTLEAAAPGRTVETRAEMLAGSDLTENFALLP